MHKSTKLFYLSALVASLCASPAAFAHDPNEVSNANEVHDAVHDQVDTQHNQVHNLLNEGVITPAEHNKLDARLQAQHRTAHRELRHDRLHDRIDQDHEQVHDLVKQGEISPAEHAAIDARLAEQHRRAHRRSWFNRLNFGGRNRSSGGNAININTSAR